MLHHIYTIGKEGNRRQRAREEEKAEAETPTPAQQSALLRLEAADMETLRCLEAGDLKDLLLPRAARTKLLHALRPGML